MKTKFIILVNALVFFVYSSNAQSKAGEINGQVSFPTGDFHDFVGNTSWAGLNGLGRWYLKNGRTSVGGSLSWFYFQDKQGVKTVAVGDGGAFTGNITNYTNIYGLQAIIQQDFKPKGEKYIPFARLGLGGAYQDQRTNTGVYQIQADGGQFMMNVDAGVRINFNKEQGMVLALTWHYLPEASDMVSTSFFGIKIGYSYFKY